jgi:hypothetical protein
MSKETKITKKRRRRKHEDNSDSFIINELPEEMNNKEKNETNRDKEIIWATLSSLSMVRHQKLIMH